MEEIDEVKERQVNSIKNGDWQTEEVYKLGKESIYD